jgi:hypothetical protein
MPKNNTPAGFCITKTLRKLLQTSHNCLARSFPKAQPSWSESERSERESGCAMTPARPAGLNAVFSIPKVYFMPLK